jgi:3'(2'), 5'-bisphosphate nucleotidase
MRLAQGDADVYPRFAPTMEWDTAASDAILRAVNCGIYQVNAMNEITVPLQYNKINLRNPYFIAI